MCIGKLLKNMCPVRDTADYLYRHYRTLPESIKDILVPLSYRRVQRFIALPPATFCEKLNFESKSTSCFGQNKRRVKNNKGFQRTKVKWQLWVLCVTLFGCHDIMASHFSTPYSVAVAWFFYTSQNTDNDWYDDKISNSLGYIWSISF